MNTINFQQTGGFPLETDTFDKMQSAYSIFNSLGKLAGDKTIIDGCVTTGNTVSDGIIYINGEVLTLRGGVASPTIVIRHIATRREFQDGDNKEVYFERYARFGSGVDAINWSDFKRIDPMLVLMQRLAELEKKTAIFQADGGMVFWNKPASEIPAGWQEVVDWRGRFPVGLDTSQAEFNNLGKVGGDKEVVLTEGQMPAHRHTGSTYSGGGHKHSGHVRQASGDWRGGGSNSAPNSTSRPGDVSYGGSHTHSLNINTAGNDEAHNNLPPYRVVLFIEYIG